MVVEVVVVVEGWAEMREMARRTTVSGMRTSDVPILLRDVTVRLITLGSLTPSPDMFGTS